jgi:hypothetical protein
MQPILLVCTVRDVHRLPPGTLHTVR